MANKRSCQLMALVIVVTVLPLWVQVHYVWTDSNTIDSSRIILNGQGLAFTGGQELSLATAHKGVRYLFGGENEPSAESSVSGKNTKTLNVTATVSQLFHQRSIMTDYEAANTLHLPGLTIYLPHIKGHPEALQPGFHFTQNRTNVTMVIGVPTVAREGGFYLGETLGSLISKLAPHEAMQTLIIVFVAEPWNATLVKNTVDFLNLRFPSELASGLLEVMSPPAGFYPDLDKIQLTLNDSRDRMKWRTKQTLDYAFLMLHAHKRGRYYLQIEDDVVTKDGFYSFIEKNIKLYGEWTVLKFSTLGFIGNLFHSKDLPFVTEFFLMFYSSKPVDWLLDNLISTKVCSSKDKFSDCLTKIRSIFKLVRPSQFQHIGYHSSLKGKIQKLKYHATVFPYKVLTHNSAYPYISANQDKTFDKPKTINPPTNQLPKYTAGFSGVPAYQAYTLDRFIRGQGIFWGVSPKKGQTIEFCFHHAISLSGFLVQSGHEDHPGDIFLPSTVIDVMPLETPPTELDKNKVQDVVRSKCWDGSFPFYSLTNFDSAGLAKAPESFPESLKKVRALRIRVMEDHTSWVIIKKFSITENS